MTALLISNGPQRPSLFKSLSGKDPNFSPPPLQKEKVIDDVSDLLTLIPSSDLNALKLMSFIDPDKLHPVIISENLELYIVSDSTKEESYLIKNARIFVKTERPDAEIIEHRVRRAVLESYIGIRNTQSLERAEGTHVQRCESILQRAIKMSATDIHIDVQGLLCTIRYRVNGILQEGETFNGVVGETIITAFWEGYVKSGMRGSLAQDGRFEYIFKDDTWLFRVSGGVSEPTKTKTMAIRARNMNDVPDINVLGYNQRQLDIMHEYKNSAGMILICGSVNSGKSTLQLSLMDQQPHDQFNLEISDQVEVLLKHFTQIQKPTRGISDASFLELELPKIYKLPTRHDINFIAINEIRDRETAALMEDLMQLGTPGISSIHAKGWPEAINRLKGPKMQVSEESLYAEGFFNLIAYQTLGRLLCDCKLDEHPDLKWDTYYKIRLGEGLAFRNPVGCQQCAQTGIKGLVAVAEFIPIREDNRAFLRDTTNSQRMRDWMRENNIPNIHQHALEKVLSLEIDPHMIRPSIGDFGEHNLFNAWRL